MNKREARLVVAASIAKKFDNNHGDLLNDYEMDILYDIVNNKIRGYTKYSDQFDDCGNPVDGVAANLLNEAKIQSE